MITVNGLDWPTTRALRVALSEVPETGTIQWGYSPCDKLDALQRLETAEILVPIHTTNRLDARAWLKSGLPVWGRKLRHSHGTDIAIPRSPKHPGKRWLHSQWWVRSIPDIVYEVRAHVWSGKCFRLGIKEFQGTPEGRPIEKCKLVRSDKNGWQLKYTQAVFDKYTTEEIRHSLRRTASRACAALNLRGGAVDLLVTSDGQVYVLEVNTAPALGPYTLSAWVARIRTVARRGVE